MINKIYKIINNKFSRFFKFIFFLKYLFVIFFVATALFLTIPHFFDYQKKERGIKSYMLQNLGLDIKSFEKIKFNSFPTPHYELKKIYSNFDTKEINLNVIGLMIIPPNNNNPEKYFKSIFELNNSFALKELSMGMSADYMTAIKNGAIGLFTEKYEDKVRTVKFNESYELCGGTHVENTSKLKAFSIISEG